ncbi:MAG: hypothetical protein ACREJ3_11760, partial [Polyangiaceae bacterium]
GYEFLGGESSTLFFSAMQAVGHPLFLGETVYPWTTSRLVTGPPVTLEMVGPGCPSLDNGTCGQNSGAPSCAFASQQCQKPEHALYVYGAEPSPSYVTFGHDTANPSTHAINTRFLGGELTPDRGFVAGGEACPGALAPCLFEAYLVKASPEPTFASQGLGCSCDNGYADCGESPTGFKTTTSTHQGDCGGTSSCGPCAVDCGDGILDYGEDNVDCGGSCSIPFFTPTHVASMCVCTPTSCTSSNTCAPSQCDLLAGGCVTNLAGTKGKTCGSAPDRAPLTCDGAGNCECEPGACTPSACQAFESCTSTGGCSYRSLGDGTACALSGGGSGTCTGGQCEACSTANCTSNGDCDTAACESGQCIHTAATDGTQACGSPKEVCLSGTCQIPTWETMVASGGVLTRNRCGQCHTLTQLLPPLAAESCFGVSCFETCYSATTKNATDCPYAADNGKPIYNCMADAMRHDEMPLGCSSTRSSNPCASVADVNILAAWVDAGAPYESNDDQVPTSCP